MLTDRFDEALAYASRLHRNQRRKGTNIPYVSHLLGVAAIALENGADEEGAIAALLHDSIEDQDVTEADIAALFGPAVARIVADCTDGEPGDRDDKSYAAWRRRKEAYVATLRKKPEASLRISLADKTHNASAILADLLAIGPTVFDRFTGKRDGTLWYYRALSEAFREQIPGHGTERLARIVDDLHHHAA